MKQASDRLGHGCQGPTVSNFLESPRLSYARSSVRVTLLWIMCFLLALQLLALPINAQSLGDIAKKNQEAKAKTESTPTKVYKNGDLTADPTAPKVKPQDSDTTSPASPTQLAKADPKTTSDKTVSDAKPAKDEAYWRDRWLPVALRLADETRKAADVAARIYDLTVELSGIGPLNARRGGVEAERQRLITESQALDTTIAIDKARLEEIREEGRRAGALPGWFR
jgi:hypothetical protein